MSGWSAGDVGPYLALLLAAVIPNGVWRWVAVFATARLDDSSPVFIWVRHVATVLVAGVVAQLLTMPPGALASVPAWMRFGALLLAAAVWWFSGRSVYVAWLAGVLALGMGAALA